MEGGGYWRDAATHVDNVTGKAYAYVGAQGTQGGGNNPNLFVFDLSYLSGEINNPNGVDSNPIPPGAHGYLSEYYRYFSIDLTFTLFIGHVRTT